MANSDRGTTTVECAVEARDIIKILAKLDGRSGRKQLDQIVYDAWTARLSKPDPRISLEDAQRFASVVTQ